MNLMQVWLDGWPALSAITARRPLSSIAATILRWAHMSLNFAHWRARRKSGVQVTIGPPARAPTSHSARPAISRIRPSSRCS